MKADRAQAPRGQIWQLAGWPALTVDAAAVAAECGTGSDDDGDEYRARVIRFELGPNLRQRWDELGRVHGFAGRRDDAIALWRAGAETNTFSP